MIAWPRWVLSAATVSRSAGSVVVKKAWKRQVSNKVPCPALRRGLRSGMRRTTNRPGTCSVAFLEVKAVKGTSATSALDTHVPVTSSKMASVYSMAVHACSLMVAITFLTLGSMRTVTDTSAPPRSAAPTVGDP